MAANYSYTPQAAPPAGGSLGIYGNRPNQNGTAPSAAPAGPTYAAYAPPSPGGAPPANGYSYSPAAHAPPQNGAPAPGAYAPPPGGYAPPPGGYAPPPGAPPAGSYAPPPFPPQAAARSYAPPSGPPPAANGSYAPPPGPPPAAKGSYAPPPGAPPAGGSYAPPAGPPPPGVPADIKPSTAYIADDGTYAAPPIPAAPPSYSAIDDSSILPWVQAYAGLVQKINSLVTIDAQLAQQTSTVNSLQANVSQAQRELTALQQQQAKEAKDVAKIEKGFSFKSLGAKMTGKYEQVKAKEIAELQMANQAVVQKQNQLNDATNVLNSAKAEQSKLAASALELKNARKSLVHTLNKAFENSHATNPNDASLYGSLQQYKSVLIQVDSDLRAHKTAMGFLGQAIDLLRQALAHIASATESQQVDMFFDNIFSEMNTLENSEDAQRKAGMAGALIRQASYILPSLPGRLGDTNIGSLDAFLTIFVDNVFTDLYNLERLREAEMKCRHTLANCSSVLAWLGTAVASISSTRDQLIGQLSNVRRSLTQYRMQCFESAVASHGASCGVTAYVAVTNFDGILPNNGVVEEAAVGGAVALSG
ncbi:hypothetical protein HDU96_005818 [Phlyctochytrium bullatum]|nr:hypothetical protein HDU96_005818 [Phlyctochytrium bullatum]